MHIHTSIRMNQLNPITVSFIDFIDIVRDSLSIEDMAKQCQLSEQQAAIFIQNRNFYFEISYF